MFFHGESDKDEAKQRHMDPREELQTLANTYDNTDAVETTPYHRAVSDVLQHFEYEHLPEPLRSVSHTCSDLAHMMVKSIADDPELTRGLHKLLTAKDCFVRAMRVAGPRPDANAKDVVWTRHGTKATEG